MSDVLMVDLVAVQLLVDLKALLRAVLMVVLMVDLVAVQLLVDLKVLMRAVLMVDRRRCETITIA
jgi:hypothetical protein